ncbi:hypothetical protein LQZ19_08640 [Treponema primitia]|uniref:hypothetical protein n=1 Tax=Treponema primitia TaxID=88058 RepID=UPI00397EA944
MTQQERQERIAYLKSLRTKVETALSGAVINAEIENYSFGDSDGTQSARRRKPAELMDMLTRINAELDTLERLDRSGGGIRTFSTKRI